MPAWQLCQQYDWHEITYRNITFAQNNYNYNKIMVLWNILFQKLFWPYTIWINCSSDLIFLQLLGLVFQKVFSITTTFFFTTDQNNFGYKIPVIIIRYKLWISGKKFKRGMKFFPKSNVQRDICIIETRLPCCHEKKIKWFSGL